MQRSTTCSAFLPTKTFVRKWQGPWKTNRSHILIKGIRPLFFRLADGTAPIQNKVGAFLADPLLNRILTAPKIDLHIRRIMDEGKVLLVNLGKGKIGEDSSSLLGGLLVTTLGLAAYSRADIPPAYRRDFFVYIDEFQSFTTLALANMLSELRKYRVGFTIAHQYLHQLEPEIRHAVLGNTGSIISFRVGAEDASYLVREFHERFEEIDFLQLPNYRIYLKLMIDGTPSTPFSAVTLGPTTNCELMVLERRNVMPFLERNPAACMKLMEILCARSRRRSAPRSLRAIGSSGYAVLPAAPQTRSIFARSTVTATLP